jgi:long-chain fatty acid transport protein
LTQNAHGSAFSIAELGARAAGMGNAFTSVADDASAVFYNPAGLAFQEGTQFQLDGLVVVGLFRFVPSAPPPGTVVPQKGFHGSIKPKFIPVASFYMSKQVSKKATFGFGVFTPFGLSANFTNFNDGDPANTKYPGRWAGTRARLEQFWFQPTLAYRLTPKMGIAAGAAFVHTHLAIESSFLNPLDDGLEFGREAAATVFPGVDKELAARSIARLLPEGRSRIAGTANAPAVNLGWIYKGDKWNFGFDFRSSVVSHLKGKASFAFGKNFALEQFIGADLLTKAFPNQPIRGLFTTPATYAFGVSRPGPMGSLISFDAKLQDYRRFSSVPLNFTVTRATNKDARTPAEQRLVFDFRNSWILSAGMEKPMMKGKMTMRAGYIYDYSPVVDKSVGPLFPDANRHSLTVGGTKRVGNKDMTLFYEAMQFRNRTTNVPQNVIRGTNGEYRNFAHVFGMGLRMRPRK